MASEREWEKIRAFLKGHIEPLSDDIYGPRYRVSATLKDGLLLPCVIFQGANKRVDLAVRRFEETKNDQNIMSGYKAIVRNFVAAGNRIAEYEIETVAESPFSIPLARLREIGGETSVGWTGFSGKMKDGKEFNFGTSYSCEFFDMPPGYTAKDIVEITPASRTAPPPPSSVFREKPYFECYIDGI